MRIAAVDCGTNSIRLLICDIDGETKVDVMREMRIVRLGQGVDKTGELSSQALERTFEACREYSAMIAGNGADTVRFCATSAARDAGNGAVFLQGVERILGVRPEILSGREEAETTYLGASRSLSAAGRVMVIDLGGGSTELVLGEGEDVIAADSLDIGSVRLTERHLASDPPTRAEIARCMADVDDRLDASEVDPAAADTVVGVAGTVTTVAAHVLGLGAYDAERIHHAVLDREQVVASCLAIAESSVDERRSWPFMHPGRADVIGAGALILARILRRTRSDELLVSEGDVLDGIAWGTVVRERARAAE